MAEHDAGALSLCDRYAVADVDSHIIEPADLWTSRVPSKWGDLVPHVRFHERRQEDYWYVGDRKLYGVGAFAQAGWPEFPPSHPRRLDEAVRAAVDAKARLAYMDEMGMYYQVLYPNIVGFHSHVFLHEMPNELATECVRAYNDWLTEFCSEDARRLIPMTMLPFWDIDASVAEMRRCHEMGHKGVLFAARYDKVGLPRLVDDYWEPLLGQAQEMGLSMNFHVGFLSSSDDLKGAVDQSKKLDFTRESALVLLGNAQNVAVCGCGTFAEAMVVDEASLIAVETDLPDDQLALLGCGVTTGLGAALNTAGVTAGSSVAVIGCGGVGQAVIQGARIAGAATIVAIDPQAERRAAGQQIGATHGVDPTGADPVAQVRELTGGRGADFSFEVVGRPELMVQAYEMARIEGTVTLVGMPAVGETITLPAMSAVFSGRRLVGSSVGGAQVLRDVPRFIRLAEAGRLDLGSLVSRHIKLDEINDGIAGLRRAEGTRTVIV